ncbi:MAG TPA: hypothetical protein VHQ45_04280 [Gemmatimonadaceae bacterium]|nr:hypothetical protein [Gemmatimonadaceae bacterium]
MPFHRTAPATIARGGLLAAALSLAACRADAEDTRPVATPPNDSAAVTAPITDSAAGVAAPPVDSVPPATAAADTGRAASVANADTSKAASSGGAKVDSAKAKDDGWPVKGPAVLPGSLLPAKRIVAYYGNPLSKRMGILGELPSDQMLARLDREVARWNAADPATPVQPALHLVTVVAQGSAGRDGKWRLRMADTLVERVISWAESRNAVVFLDVQVGLSTLQEELPRLEQFLKRPNVHLGVDPEFSMKGGQKPGSRIGTFDAADINYASRYLQELVAAHQLPPKVLVVHRFTRRMLTNTDRITLDPRVQVVIHMDGWGPPTLKRDSYRHYVHAEPVQFTGFKLFYNNDTKKGHPLMTPEQILALHPKPLYIQYQ